MAENKNIHAGHRGRMRKRFLKHGIDSFNQHEVLEILLYHVCLQKNTNVDAHMLIEEFGSLSGVLNASVADLKKAGLGEASAVYLSMMPHIFRIYQADMQKEGTKISSAAHAADCLVPMLSHSMVEEVAIACLDAKNRVINKKVIKRGSPSKIDVSIREITHFALSCHAVAIIIGHSHPNGSALPSPSDLRFTQTLYETLCSLEVVLLEHVIVGENGELYSFHSHAEISRIHEEYKQKYPHGLRRTVEGFD